MKLKYSKKGDKVKIEKCPDCNEQLVVDLGEDRTEVFTCKKCSFKVERAGDI